MHSSYVDESTTTVNHFVKCSGCGLSGPEKPTPDEALKVWNQIEFKC